MQRGQAIQQGLMLGVSEVPGEGCVLVDRCECIVQRSSCSLPFVAPDVISCPFLSGGQTKGSEGPLAHLGL